MDRYIDSLVEAYAESIGISADSARRQLTPKIIAGMIEACETYGHHLVAKAIRHGSNLKRFELEPEKFTLAYIFSAQQIIHMMIAAVKKRQEMRESWNANNFKEAEWMSQKQQAG